MVGSAAVVVLALIGVGTYLLVSSGGSGSSPTTTTTASTAAPSPSTTAASTDFSAVTGTWTAHGSTLVIDASGHGSVGLPDSTACPSCSEAQAPTNTIAFTLTSVSDGQAVGAVTAVSDPRDPVTQSGAPAALGASVTIFPTTTAGQLQLEIAGSPVDQYCNPTAGATGACGA